MTMRIAVSVGVTLFLLAAAPVDPAAAQQQEANKKAALEFYDKAINQKDWEAASKYLGPKYIQHNPGVADGHEGLKDVPEKAANANGMF